MIVLLEVKAKPKQDAFFENARGHVGVADGTEQDGVAATKPFDLGSRARPLLSADTVRHPGQTGSFRTRNALEPRDRVKNREPFRCNLGADTVSRHDSKLDQKILRRHELEAEIRRP